MKWRLVGKACGNACENVDGNGLRDYGERRDGENWERMEWEKVVEFEFDFEFFCSIFQTPWHGARIACTMCRRRILMLLIMQQPYPPS